jgi:hypothetical protein
MLMTYITGSKYALMRRLVLHYGGTFICCTCINIDPRIERSDPRDPPDIARPRIAACATHKRVAALRLKTPGLVSGFHTGGHPAIN